MQSNILALTFLVDLILLQFRYYYDNHLTRVTRACIDCSQFTQLFHTLILTDSGYDILFVQKYITRPFSCLLLQRHLIVFAIKPSKNLRTERLIT